MSSELLGLLGIVLLLGLILVRIPIALAMVVVGAGGFAWLAGLAPLLSQLKTIAYWRFSTYDLSVVPLFMLMGQFATRAGLSQDLFRAANAWVGHLRGGMAIGAIGACAGFGAICGSSLATASRPWARWRCRNCAGTATSRRSPPARSPPAARSAS